MNLLTLLDLRLKTALESPTDRRFYQNVHSYLDLIMKDEKGRSIIKKAERDYSTNHSELWREKLNTDEQFDEQSRQTLKIERFNLYADKFVGLYVRIYLPIKDYLSSDEPHGKSHPVALVALYGIKSSIVDNWCKYPKRSFPYKEAKKQMVSYARWFDGKRDEYTNDLKQFHADFITKYIQSPDVAPGNKSVSTEDLEPPIYLDPRTGDFTYPGFSGTLNPTRDEYKVLFTLLKSPNYFATYLEIIQSYRGYVKEVTKSEKTAMYKVITALRKQLGTTEENGLIETVKNSAYRLRISPKEDRED